MKKIIIATTALLALAACGGPSEVKVVETPTTTEAVTTTTEEVPLTTTAPPATTATSEAPTTAVPAPVTFKAAHIVDGDTLDIIGSDGQQFTVRIIGIDTPEVGSGCAADLATAALQTLIGDHDLTFEQGGADDMDHYGRYLRYVHVGTTDVGFTLINGGFAVARYDSRDGYGSHTKEAEYIAADDTSDPVSCEVVAPVTEPPAPSPAPVPETQPVVESVYYANCDDARSAGAAPLHRGDPGYRAKMDRDGDGIACE